MTGGGESVDWEECEICGDLYPWIEGSEICDQCLAEIADSDPDYHQWLADRLQRWQSCEL